MTRRHPALARRRAGGFSLLEMAIVLVIVGLLLGGMLGGLGSLRMAQSEEATRRQLEEIREALVSFAVINRRLPCPAAPATPDSVAGAGIERAPTATGCTGGSSGVLPWATLGLPQTDTWGRRFSYRVTPAFAGTAPAFQLTSIGDNTIQNLSAVQIAVQVPAVVISHGVNGAGGRNHLGAAVPAGTNAGEIENADADGSFVMDVPSAGFDDLAVWVPTPLLVGRMLQAGVLP